MLLKLVYLYLFNPIQGSLYFKMKSNNDLTENYTISITIPSLYTW